MSHPKYVHLKPGELPPAVHRADASRVVLIAEAIASSAYREAVARELIESGCLYFMSWGVECEAWHDEVDMASIQKFDFQEIPEDAFVMTSWHERESLSEVFWFCKNNAFHPTVDLKVTVLLHLAPNSNEQELLTSYTEA
jgi:hypothetical protein